MRRRDFIVVLAATTLPLAARAQTSTRRPLIAWLSGGTQAGSKGFVEAFLQGMRDFDYIEGRDFDMAYRYADGYAERLPALADELVRLKPNVILAAATGQAVAAKNATATIPIVTPALADAIHLHLIASDARPGGNVTGITPYVEGLPAKQMELAREVVPGAKSIGVLNNSNDPKAPPQWQELQAAGHLLEIDVLSADARSPDDLPGAVQALADQKVDVVIVLQTSMLVTERRQVAELAAARKLPMIYGYREHVVEGGLISYGVDLRYCFRHAATFVHKILNGTTPGDLPVEFPTKVELVINMKTAKALGLDLTPSLLARADEVIE
jgi:putative ABC transport system substrate-binding protein